MSTKFTIPKKAATTDLIVEKPLDSRESQHLLEVIKHSYWNPQSRIEVIKTKFVNNGSLANEYNAKRKAMKSDGRVGPELNEVFCFKYSETRKEAMDWCTNGIQTNKQGLVYPCIGDQDSGVYLTRCADMVFRYPATASLTGFYLVFKVIQGRLKVVQDQFGSQTQLEPTPEFDGHVSKKFQPGKTTMTHSQIYDASQIYLYEIDLENMDYSVPGSMYVKRPRQILPYAIVQFSLNLQARDLPVLRAAPIESRRISKNEPRLGIEQESVKDAQIPQDVPKAESHDSFYYEQLKRSPLLWRGNLFNRERFLTEVQIVCHSRTGFLLPITGSVLSFRLSVKIFDLKEILPQTLFLSKPVVSQNSKVVVDDANYLHCEIHPTQPRSSAMSKLITTLQRKQEALTVEFNAGNKLFILPTCQLTTDLGITDKSYPIVLHGIFMNKTRGRTVEDTDLRFCKRVRLFLERRLLELEILKADDPGQVFTAEQKFLERFKRDHVMLFSDGEKQNIKVQLTQMKKNAAKVAINRKVSMQRLALAQQRQNLVENGQSGEPYLLQGAAPPQEHASQPSVQFGSQRYPARSTQNRSQPFVLPGHSGYKGHDVARGNSYPLVSHVKDHSSQDGTSSFVPISKPEGASEVWTPEMDHTDESTMNDYFSGESRDSTGMRHSYLEHNSFGTLRPDDGLGKHNANYNTGSVRDVSPAMIAPSSPLYSAGGPTRELPISVHAQMCPVVDHSRPVPNVQQNHADMDDSESLRASQMRDLSSQHACLTHTNPNAIVPKPKDPRLIRVMKEDLYSQTSGTRNAQTEASDLEGGSTDMDISSDDMSQGEETNTETPSESGGEQGKNDITLETKPENRSKRLRLDEYKKRFSAKIVGKSPSLSQANEAMPSAALVAGGPPLNVDEHAKDGTRLIKEGEGPFGSDVTCGPVESAFSDASSSLKEAGAPSRSSVGSPSGDGKKTKKDFVELFSQLAQNFVELKSVLKGEGTPLSLPSSESLFSTDSKFPIREEQAIPRSLEQKLVLPRSQEYTPLWPPLPPETLVEDNHDSHNVELPPPPPLMMKDRQLEGQDSQKESPYFERVPILGHSLPSFSHKDPLPDRTHHEDYGLRNINPQVMPEIYTRQKEIPTKQIPELSSATESFPSSYKSEYEHDRPNKGTQSNSVSSFPQSAGSSQATVVVQNRMDSSTSAFLKMSQPYSSNEGSLDLEGASTRGFDRNLQGTPSLPVSTVEISKGDESLRHVGLRTEFREGVYRDISSLENSMGTKLDSQALQQGRQFSTRESPVLDSSSQMAASTAIVVPMDIDDDSDTFSAVDNDAVAVHPKGNSSLPVPSIEGQPGQSSTNIPESSNGPQKDHESSEPEQALKESNSLVDLAGFSFDSGHLPWEEKEESDFGVGLPAVPPMPIEPIESPPKLPAVSIQEVELEGSTDPFSPNYNPRKVLSLVQSKCQEKISPLPGLDSQAKELLKKHEASQSGSSLNAPLYFRGESPYSSQPYTSENKIEAQYTNRSSNHPDDSRKERGGEAWRAEPLLVRSKRSSFDGTTRSRVEDRILPRQPSHTVADELPGNWASGSFENSRQEAFHRRTDIEVDVRSTDTGYVSVRIRDGSRIYRQSQVDERDWTVARPGHYSLGHCGSQVHRDGRPDHEVAPYPAYDREKLFRDDHFAVRARRDLDSYERRGLEYRGEPRGTVESSGFQTRYQERETSVDETQGLSWLHGPAYREVVSQERHVVSMRDRSFEKQQLDEFDANRYVRYSRPDYSRISAEFPNSMASLESRRRDEHWQKVTNNLDYRGSREELYREFSQVREKRPTSSTPSYHDRLTSREYQTSYQSAHETPLATGERPRHVLPAAEDLDQNKASITSYSEYWRAKLQDLKEQFMTGNTSAGSSPVTERKAESPRTLQDALELKQSEWYEDSHVDVTSSQKEVSSPPRLESEEFNIAEMMDDPDEDLHITDKEDAKVHDSKLSEEVTADSRVIRGGRQSTESGVKPILEPISPFKALDHAARSAVELTTTLRPPPIDPSRLVFSKGLFGGPERETSVMTHSSSYSSPGPLLHNKRLYRPSGASSQSSSLSRSQSTSGSRSYSRSRSRSRSRRYSRSRSRSHSRSRSKRWRSRRRSRSRRSYSRSLSRSRSISTSSSRSYSRSRSRSRSRYRSRTRSRSRSRTPSRLRGRSRTRSRSRSSSRSRSRSRSLTNYDSRRSKHVSERQYHGRNRSNSRSRRRSHSSDRSKSRSRTRTRTRSRSNSRSRSRKHSSQRSKYRNILASVVGKSGARSPIPSNLQNSKKYGKWVRYESLMRQEKPERKSESKKDRKAAAKKEGKRSGQQASLLKGGKVNTKGEVRLGSLDFDRRETRATLAHTVKSSAVVARLNTSEGYGSERNGDSSVAAGNLTGVESDIEEGQISPRETKGGMVPLSGDGALSAVFPSSCEDVIQLERDVISISPVKRNIDETRLADNDTRVWNGADETNAIKKSGTKLGDDLALKDGNENRTVESEVGWTCYPGKTGENNSTSSRIEIENSNEPLAYPTPSTLSVRPLQFGEGKASELGSKISGSEVTIIMETTSNLGSCEDKGTSDDQGPTQGFGSDSKKPSLECTSNNAEPKRAEAEFSAKSPAVSISNFCTNVRTAQSSLNLIIDPGAENLKVKSHVGTVAYKGFSEGGLDSRIEDVTDVPLNAPLTDKKGSSKSHKDADEVERSPSLKETCHLEEEVEGCSNIEESAHCTAVGACLLDVNPGVREGAMQSMKLEGEKAKEPMCAQVKESISLDEKRGMKEASRMNDPSLCRANWAPQEGNAILQLSGTPNEMTGERAHENVEKEGHSDSVNVAISSSGSALGLIDHLDIDSKILNIFRDSIGPVLTLSQTKGGMQKREVPTAKWSEDVSEDDQVKAVDVEPCADSKPKDFFAPSGTSERSRTGTTTSGRPDAVIHTLDLSNVKEEEMDEEENAVNIEEVSLSDDRAKADQEGVLDQTSATESKLPSVNHASTGDSLSLHGKDEKLREDIVSDKETFILSDKTLSFLDQQSCARLAAIRDSKMEKVKRFLSSLPHDQMYVYDSTNFLSKMNDAENPGPATAPAGSTIRASDQSEGEGLLTCVHLTNYPKTKSNERTYQNDSFGSDPSPEMNRLSEHLSCPAGTPNDESGTKFHTSQLKLSLSAGIEPISDHEAGDFLETATPNNPLLPSYDLEAIRPVVSEYEQLRLWGGKLGRKEHDRGAVKIFLKRLLNERKARRLDEFRRLAPELNNNCVFGKICLDAIKSVKDKICVKMDSMPLHASTDELMLKEGT